MTIVNIMNKKLIMKKNKVKRKNMAKVQNRKRTPPMFIKKLIKHKDELCNYKYSVEHALNMYANSFITLPADILYEKEKISEYKNTTDNCHIYIIGYLPIIHLENATKIGNDLKLSFSVCNKKEEIYLSSIPSNLSFICENDNYYLEDLDKNRFWWNDIELTRLLHQELGCVQFNVKYVGQAYGRNGSRSALDRLIKHETLQKIAIKGVPEGYKLSLLLLEVKPNTSIITAFTPNAQVKDTESVRIKAGLDKLFNTSEAERISLYEAALIRYFSPEYNKEFKDSFPSTNLKILQDCYNKDISAVIAEINIDELPFMLFSDSVEPKRYHISTHHLHKDNDRKVFFGI